MTFEIPQYGLKAYALFFAKYGTTEEFKQSALDWIVSESMKKKIFALLLRAGWITKRSENTYSCVAPADAITGLLAFRVPTIMKTTTRPYAFTQLSAVEIWSDFSYVQRGMERSPYFIKVLEKDVAFWRMFFNKHEIPNYVEDGATIGEYIVLIPIKTVSSKEKEGFKVDSLQETIKYAAANEMYAYASEYMKKKYGAST